MKVGIMSMQRIRNYGSFLQSYGLKITIENLGHEVVFLDYKVENPIVVEKKRNLCSRIFNKLYRMSKGESYKRKDITVIYDEQYLPMLGIGKEKNYNDEVDVLVIGSDEVFNCLQSNPLVGYSKELFGKNNRANRLISYAASCGHTTLDGLKKYKIDNEIGSMLKKFDKVSVRDENTYNTVKSLTGKKPSINVDPVIISNFDKYIPEQKELKNYIIVYAYPNRISSKEEIDNIKSFARKYNKQIVSIGTHQYWTDIKIEANPLELLGYVKNADYIITDTFHGSIFAMKYNIPFATIIRESNREKLSDLLKRFNLSNREVKDINKLENILLDKINFEDVNRIIKNETEKSINYLKENII